MKNFYVFFFFMFSILSAPLYSQGEEMTFIPDEKGNLQMQGQDLFAQNEEFFRELPTQDYQGAFIKMFVVLGLLLTLISVTIWLIKRLMKNRAEVANNHKIIQVIEKRILSPKSILYLIEVDNQKILISESQLEVRPLQNLSESKGGLEEELSDLDPDFLLAESSKL